jgi:hypothetical protein
MRSLNLLFGKTSSTTTFQIIWEVWITVSLVGFLLTTFVTATNIYECSTDILILLGFHTIVSTVVGCVTYESK